jgi:Cdc6-like AAA superfamily ATPase
MPEVISLVGNPVKEYRDPRRALDHLRTAGGIADREGAGAIEVGHVERASLVVDADRIRKTVRALPPQEVLIVYTLADLQWGRNPESAFPPISTEDLIKHYREEAEFWGLPSKGRRRCLDLLRDPEVFGLTDSLTESAGRYGRRKLHFVEGDVLLVREVAWWYLARHYRPDVVTMGHFPKDKRW